jgi:predicted chitinase
MSTPNPLETPAGAYGLTRDQSVQLIVETALRHGVTDRSQIAYMLATAEHESDNFLAAREYGGREQARLRDYSGGEEFYGRGYVHTTHDYNYLAMGEALGLGTALRDDPDRAATDPRLAADLLVVGMQRGLYTGRALGDYVNEDGVDYANARRVVNGIDRAEHIAGLARGWEAQVPALVDHIRNNPVDLSPMTEEPGRDGFFSPGERGEDVRGFQRSLNTASGERVVEPDGVYGEGMRREVGAFQREQGIPVTGIADPATREAVQGQVRQRQWEAAPTPPLDSSLPGRESQPPGSRHPTHERIREQVQEMDRSLGRVPDESSERVAAALWAEANAQRLHRIDGVVLGQKGTKAEAGEYVFAYSGSRERPDDWVSVRTEDAIRTPVEQSVARAETLQRQHAVEVQQYAQAQQQSSDAPVRSMG